MEAKTSPVPRRVLSLLRIGYALMTAEEPSMNSIIELTAKSQNIASTVQGIFRTMLQVPNAIGDTHMSWKQETPHQTAPASR